jgi:plastocyanin/mono/diheme cytochrome c family protein
MNTSKQINIIVALIFLSLIATGAYTMWDPSRADTAKEDQLNATLERGAFLFSQNCRTCHGDSGEGGQRSNRLREAPPLNRPDLQGREAEGAEPDKANKANAYRLVFNTINCGRVGKAMPTWGQEQGGVLNDEQMRQLTIFITEGTHWEEAKHFAIEGFPEGQVHGDAEVPFTLAEPIGEAESDTVIVLSNASTLSAGERLQFGEEVVVITNVDVKANTITVERGVGTTRPEAHEPGVEILKPPVPPDPAPLTGSACGQLPQAQATAAPEPASDKLTITSQGIAWDKTELSALPDVPLTLTHIHNDPGQQHNWALYPDEGAAIAGDPILAATEIEGGPTTQTLNFGPLAAGEYYYQCDVHPQMNGTLVVAAATADGAEPVAEATLSVAEGDPAAAETP